MNDSPRCPKGLLLKETSSSSSVAGQRLLGSTASLRRVAVELHGADLGRSVAGLVDLGVVEIERLGAYLGISTTRTTRRHGRRPSASGKEASDLGGRRLSLGLGAIAVGFVAGLVVPIRAFERENLGPLGDRLTDRAQDSAALLVARGTSAVVEVVSAALKPPTK